MPLAVVALVAALTATDACGQNTWVGGVGGNGLWATGTNWSTTSAPTGTYNQTLVFAGSPLLSSTNNISGLTLSSGTGIRFDAAGFTLSGSAITLGGNIFSSLTTGSNTISLAGISVSTMRTISGSYASGTATHLIVSSNISGAGGITLGAGNSTAGNTPSYTLTGSNSFTGGFTLSNFTVLNANSAAAFGQNVVSNKLTLGRSTINYTGSSAVFANNVDITSSGGPITVNLSNAAFEFSGTTSIGTTGQAAGIAVNSGTVTFRSLSGTGGGTSNAGGTISGSNGTLVIKESSSYSGNFRLAASTNAAILLGHGQALGTGTAAVINSNVMSIGSTQDVTVASTIFNTGIGTYYLSLGGDYRFTVQTGITGTGAIRKFGSGILDLTAVNTYSGTTSVGAGTLLVNGSILNSGTVSVSAGATLGGSGSVNVITGGGLVSPGNSPGILTGTSVTLSSGLDFAFEFTQAGSPTWSTGTASGNDVLRLTNLTTPISNVATAANVFNIYFAADGQTYRGGLFTDRTSSFESSIANATYNYYVQNATGTVTFNGTKYNALASADVTRSTVQVTSANFSGGTVSNGYTMEFVVVPEPQTIVLFGIGSAFIGWSLISRRRRVTERSAD